MKQQIPISLDDSELVRLCLAGEERAWEALLQKYKRLIYAIILKYRMTDEDAADIFQAVCVDLFQELVHLRNVGAIRGWLGRVTANRCFHWKRRKNLHPHDEVDESIAQPGEEMPEWLESVERDQMVREAMDRLSPRCRELLRMLFFEDPPRPYDAVARQLSLATGSIGFIRGRCLKKLESELAGLGL
ncbi:MAG: sigma-70 family RNA polymerase sigma factor [Bryobacterales bacterium]|nr:sigma-70 family RNA polymerase sigma factor [Bryobacterales bacterium]